MTESSLYFALFYVQVDGYILHRNIFTKKKNCNPKGGEKVPVMFWLNLDELSTMTNNYEIKGNI